MTNLELKELRKKLHLTQAELAKSIGVDIKTIQNWEAGKKIPQTKDGILRALMGKNYSVEGGQHVLLGDAVNGNKTVQEIRKLKIEEEDVIENSSVQSDNSDKLLDLLQQKQKSLDELIAQQGRYLSIIETLTNKITSND